MKYLSENGHALTKTDNFKKLIYFGDELSVRISVLNEVLFLFFRQIHDIQRFFQNILQDETALRWLKPGFMQLFFSIPMLAFGRYFEDVEICSIDNISEKLISLGVVMTIFASIHIILGLLTHYGNRQNLH